MSATPGEHCSSSCLTKDHLSFGECVRSKNVGDYRLGGYRDGGRDSTYDRAFQHETDRYGQAVKDGLKPEAVTNAAVTAAYAAAEKGA